MTPAARGLANAELYDELRAIGAELRRLTVSRRDPEAFHVRRSDLVARVERLAEGVRTRES